MLNSSQKEPHKNDDTPKNTSSELNRSKCTLVKGPKPLQKFKFYLDIKSHVVSNKLESKIKELGGATEYFLVQEVTHVISDSPHQCSESVTISSPVTPRLIRSIESANDSPGPSPTVATTVGRLRLKTRSDAMLEKVRSQATTKVRDPLENAKLWGIPIWTVNKIFSYLEKVSASITLQNVSQKSNKTVKVISIKAPFIKFEPNLRDARPVYKPLESWPVINLEASLGKPAFSLKTIQNIAEVKVTDPKPDLEEAELPTDTPNESKMTRKQRTRLSVRSSLKAQEVERQTIVGGFCEICHCEYREIGEHVRSEQHLNFVKNDANFLELDSLISAGANVEAFLRLNGSTSNKDTSSTCPLFARRSLRKINGKPSSGSPEKCNGLTPRTPNNYSDYSPPVTRNKMPRTRSSNQNSALSPTGSDGGHQLRSRGQLWLPTALIGTTAEDEQFANVKKEFGNRKSCGRDEEMCGKPERLKKLGQKTNKRVSADERLVADNRTYYKVEVMTTKLRSSGLGAREHEVVRRIQTPIPEDSEPEDQSLVVKFKRVRKSELSVLNDEAENFMFPRKEDDETDCETDDGAETTRSSIKSESSDLKTSEAELKIKEEVIQITDEDSIASSVLVNDRKRKRIDVKSDLEDLEVEELGRGKRKKIMVDMDETGDETSKDDILDSDYICRQRKKKKKRRTQAETFLADNQRYYKFQTPGSRLRYQGSVFAQTASKTITPAKPKSNGEIPQEKEVPPPPEIIKPQLTVANLKFSFEFLPKSEPWYKTFQRQDSGDEFYTCFSDMGHTHRFILPYQLPYLPPVDPKSCVEEYNRKRLSYLKVETGTDEGSMDSLPGSSGTADNEENSTENKEIDVIKQESKQPNIRRRKKRRFIKLSNHPRKSPRQHASTLAILSSLIQQRKKRARKSEQLTNAESDNSRLSLTSIPEDESTPVKLVNSVETTLHEQESIIEAQNQSLINSALEEIFTAPMDEFSELDLTHDGIEIYDKPDAIELIETFDQVTNTNSKSSNKTPVLNRNGRVRKIRRKRNKNRTGWPKKKRLFPARRMPGKKEEKDVNKIEKLPELDDSRLSDLSVENIDLEMCELTREDVSERLNTLNNETDLKQGEIWTENINKISEKNCKSVVDNNNSVVDNMDDNSVDISVKMEQCDVIKPEPTQTINYDDLESEKHKDSSENIVNCFEMITTNIEIYEEEILKLNMHKKDSVTQLNNSETLEHSSATQNNTSELESQKKVSEIQKNNSEIHTNCLDIHTNSLKLETPNTDLDLQKNESGTTKGSLVTEKKSSEIRNANSETQKKSLDVETQNGSIDDKNMSETHKKDSKILDSASETQKNSSNEKLDLGTFNMSTGTLKLSSENKKQGLDRQKKYSETQQKNLETQKNRENKKIEAETRKFEDQKIELRSKIHRNLTLILEPLKNDLMKLENIKIEHNLSESQLEGEPIMEKLSEVTAKGMDIAENQTLIKEKEFETGEKRSETLEIPRKTIQRTSSSECSGAEEVIPSATDRFNECVHVTLDKWENAEKVLHAKMNDNDRLFQPFVRVQKIDNSTALQVANRRLRSSSSPERKPKAKRAKIVAPSSPRSPRKLRAPRGKWYRER